MDYDEITFLTFLNTNDLSSPESVRKGVLSDLKQWSKNLETPTQLTAIKNLFSHGFTVTPKHAENHRFLHYTVMKGHVDIVRDLLKYVTGEHLSNYRYHRGNTILHCAALYRQTEIVKLLLKHGCDANARNFEGSSAICALLSGTIWYIRKLCKEQKKITEAFDGVEKSCLEVLEVLLENGVDPKTRDDKGKTVLHYTVACFLEMEEVAKVLLREGVDVNIADDQGVTPLFLASFRGHKGLFRIFLEHGGLNFGRFIDRKVVEEVSRGEYREYFTLSLERHFADIDAVDYRGTTTLQYAYKKEYVELVGILLGYGADVNAGKKRWWRGLNKDFLPVGRIVKMHMAKLKLAGLKIPKNSLILHDDDFRELKYDCEELENMKDGKIANTTVSFSDILTEDLDQLAAFTENENVMVLLTSSEWRKRFPLYADVIQGFLWRGIVRKGLVDKAKGVFRDYCNGLPELPDVCVKEIFKCLTNRDLRRFICAQKNV